MLGYRCVSPCLAMIIFVLFHDATLCQFILKRINTIAKLKFRPLQERCIAHWCWCPSGSEQCLVILIWATIDHCFDSLKGAISILPFRFHWVTEMKLLRISYPVLIFCYKSHELSSVTLGILFLRPISAKSENQKTDQRGINIRNDKISLHHHIIRQPLCTS